MRSILAVALLCAFAISANATWKPEFSEHSLAIKLWFSEAKVNEAAHHRPGADSIRWKSCCETSDRFKTKFHVAKGSGADEWFYCAVASVDTCPADQWKLIPDDVIHHEGIVPPPGHENEDPVAFAQLRTEGILFIFPAVGGEPTCFWPPESGG